MTDARVVAILALSLFFVVDAQGGSGGSNVPQCGENEVYQECSERELNCGEVLTGYYQTRCGSPKCVCPASEGYRRDVDGKCVEESECDYRASFIRPSHSCLELSCGPDEECILQNIACTKPPCFPAATCVPKLRCPANEVFRECRTCEASCEKLTNICPLICKPAGCECPAEKGFVRDYRGKCINKKHCPKLPSCIGHVCADNERCVLQKVQCFVPPCFPIPTCVPL